MKAFLIAHRRLIVSAVTVTGLVSVSAACLLSAQRSFLGAIEELNSTSSQTTQIVVDLRYNCREPAEQERMQALRNDIENRLADVESPAHVVAGLSQTCRSLGAMVMEISPVAGADPGPAARRQRYRLKLRGSYRQIAAVMAGCMAQRLPAAVVEFSIRPGDDVSDIRLTAEIVVECFDPNRVRPRPAAEGQAT